MVVTNQEPDVSERKDNEKVIFEAARRALGKQISSIEAEEVVVVRDAMEAGRCRVLGTGQFGTVYLVNEPINVALRDYKGKEKSETYGCVAVKEIKEEISHSQRNVDDFMRELNLLKRLDHPNILQILFTAAPDGNKSGKALWKFSNERVIQKKMPLIITEYADCDLSTVLTRTIQLSMWRRLELVYDFAKGLEYLHTLRPPLIHRDLKPANLLLVGVYDPELYGEKTSERPALPITTSYEIRQAANEDIQKYFGRLQIADFGLATQFLDDPAIKMSGMTGSHRYMAPEVAKCEKYNTSSDIFSFAMILFQALEGLPPMHAFAGEEASALYCSRTRPAFVQKKFSPAEASARDLCKRCWATNAIERPTATEIVKCMKEIIDKLPRTAKAKEASAVALRKWTTTPRASESNCSMQ